MKPDDDSINEKRKVKREKNKVTLRIRSGEYYVQKITNTKVKKWLQVGPVVRKGIDPPEKVSTWEACHNV